MNYPERYMINSVKLNDRGQQVRRRGVRARRRAAQRRRRRRRGSSSTRRARTRAIRTRPARPDASSIWGARGTRSAVIFDVDGDGDLDIVTNEFNAAPMVLVSNLTEKTRVHYVAVKLIGTTSNRDGLGAVVKVTAGGIDLHEGDGRQLRLSVAQPVSAVFRARRQPRRSTASR